MEPKLNFVGHGQFRAPRFKSQQNQLSAPSTPKAELNPKQFAVRKGARAQTYCKLCDIELFL